MLQDPESRPREFGIRTFYFGLDRKIPKIPKSRGSGFENPKKKIPKEKSRKSQNPGDRDRDFKTFKKSGKSRVQNHRDSGFFSIRIFIPGIRDFYHRDSEFFLISGFFTFWLSRKFFILGIGIFFRGMEYPDKKPPLL